MFKQILKKAVVSILTLEARLVLGKYKPKIIAVTGSVGKTGTKDAIRAVLEQSFFIRGSKKSYNSEIGVPLTILGAENAWGSPFLWLKVFFEGLLLILLKNHYPDWLILEVGVDHPGDMRRVTQWLVPDVVVLTRFSEVPVHLEFFPSREALVGEKKILARALKADGVLIVNADDAEVQALRQGHQGTSFSFGFGESADIRGTSERLAYDQTGMPNGMTVEIQQGGSKEEVSIKNVLGRPVLYSVLAASAVGIALGIPLKNIAKASASLSTAPGRMRTIRGVQGSLIIDDSYNSSPGAAREALETLQEIGIKTSETDPASGGRKIALLGDMLELGKESAAEHKKIGALAKEICNVLVTVGVRSSWFEEGARAKKMKKADIFHFGNATEAGEFLRGFLREGDVILVKGSQSGIRLERAVKLIMAEPNRARELLVRQEDEWGRR
ncbi:MAG: UDP-N-acetylmuramoyl-tripeptide--D-alanyl-D-alanine ligase [Parcubacteria group bacterium]|nr:UDP-N-acetylmuramoyl-tripeptide--D-alanyl-D-alanine ligase [Parcubacteria group bacterium]